MRSAGPLNPNPFGQVLATSAVLAFYLAAVERRLPAPSAGRGPRGGVRGGRHLHPVAGGADRAADRRRRRSASLRGVRLRVLAVAACGVDRARLPGAAARACRQRVDALSDAASSVPARRDDGSLRGRKSENLAGLRDVGGPPAARGRTRQLRGPLPEVLRGDRDRSRGPSSAGPTTSTWSRSPRPGCSGRLAFLGVLWLALSGAWRARSPPDGPRTPCSARGSLVALGAFLICAVTLHSAYARYEWIFLGLGLAAGRLARRPAR